jgi:hypothetical protein
MASVACLAFRFKVILNDKEIFFYCSLAVVTPFFSVSLIESVQSDIASESPVRNLQLF